MANGRWGHLAEDVESKLSHQGMDGVSEKELLILLVYKMDTLRFLAPKYVVPLALAVVAMIIGGPPVASRLAEVVAPLLGGG